MSWNDLPGLGTATGTRVDSAAKHIMACKVDTRLLANLILHPEKHDAINVLHNEKMKWCMHKDEIVLNTSKSEHDPSVKAYPMVITTVGDMKPEVRNYLKYLYEQSNASDFFEGQELHRSNDAALKEKCIVPAGIEADKWAKILQQIKSLPDFRCQGVALGQAWASYLTGDTVASVLVGGMVTVQNGHFTMHTGDMVQWYFDFEQDKYDSSNKNTHGCRNPARAAAGSPRNRNNKRERYLDERLYGNSSFMGKNAGQKDTATVVRVKSYRMKHVTSSLLMLDHYGDKIRVFAKCISGGRPFDMVDIMLMTQSL